MQLITTRNSHIKKLITRAINSNSYLGRKKSRKKLKRIIKSPKVISTSPRDLIDICIVKYKFQNIKNKSKFASLRILQLSQEWLLLSNPILEFYHFTIQ